MMESQPQENILSVLSFCDARTLYFVGQVCSALRNISKDEALWGKLLEEKQREDQKFRVVDRRYKSERGNYSAREWYIKWERKITVEAIRMRYANGKYTRSRTVEISQRAKNTVRDLKFEFEKKFSMIRPHYVTVSVFGRGDASYWKDEAELDDHFDKSRGQVFFFLSRK